MSIVSLLRHVVQTAPFWQRKETHLSQKQLQKRLNELAIYCQQNPADMEAQDEYFQILFELQYNR